ncbi:hypothetical protein KIN20_023035 [Parelaphostrongylus tenuis]|uniref:Uncharacterized protein n=1 Tax=Parelaphostrongylus tenuis TaxID=148309 RepID=A0AAD5N649_PARTN|nr:hypothetical protein KIN20_023035 [Parelaphostrongylus tenuis]
MFANGPADQQQFYQTPPAPPQQQQTPTQPHQSVIVRQPELPDEPDESGYSTASASYYGLAPSSMVPNAYPAPYNMNVPIPFLFSDWNQLGMVGSSYFFFVFLLVLK